MTCSPVPATGGIGLEPGISTSSDGTHADYKLIPNVYEENGVLKAKGHRHRDRHSYRRLPIWETRSFPWMRLTVWDGAKNQSKRFNNKSGIVLEVSAPTNWGS